MLASENASCIKASTMGVSQQPQQQTLLCQSQNSYYVDLSCTQRHDSESSSELLESIDRESDSRISSSAGSPISFSSFGDLELEGQTESDSGTCQNSPVPESVQPSARPKYGNVIIGITATPINPEEESDTKDKSRKKKRKWKGVNAEEVGFNLSLFPRAPVCVEDSAEQKTELQIFLGVSEELERTENQTRPFSRLLQLEGCFGCRHKTLRKDSGRKEAKAHKQVKTKHITSLQNNPGRKTLYIHFRLYKLHSFLQREFRSHPNLPSRPRQSGVCMDVAKSAIKANLRSINEETQSRRLPHPRHPPQNLAHALDNANAASELPTDVVSFLISLQHREMTPEDYDMLLRLDDGVAPKTVAQNTLSSFKTDVVDESSAGRECSVCMEVYELGHKRKFLPCGHDFHEECITMWLANSSQNCPLDGLPVGFS